MRYYDTSILVAASLMGHPHYATFLASLSGADKSNAACSTHTLAEVYSVLTRIPPPLRLTGDQALMVVEAIRSKMTCVTLTSAEYASMLRSAAARGIVGGAIHDALHISCARKVRATRIYTLNLRDFRRIDPELANIMHAP
jgi:predicted nucleic acid-binding protein